MYKSTRKLGPRAEYREEQGQRVTAAPCLAEAYQSLKSLTVNVGYYAPDGINRYRQLTYDVNLDHAKSVFRFDCCNDECVQGDHELTEALAKAVASHSKSAAGELRCNGWQNKASIQKAKCNHIFHYKLKLGY
jgi:hypothetical protein